MNHLDFAHKELERVGDWIDNADTKSSIVLALNGGLLALFVGNLKVFFPRHYSDISLLAGAVFLGAAAYSVYAALRVLLPEIKVKTKKKLFFFGTISAMPVEEYKKEFQALTEQEMTDEVLDQAYANSTIAANKFSHLKKSVQSLSVASVAIFLLLLIGLML